MNRARAAAKLSSARQVDWCIARFAASHNSEQHGGVGFADKHGESETVVAEGANAPRSAVCGAAAMGGKQSALMHPCLPHMEQFVSGFEEALGTIDGMEQRARENLVKVARGPAVR